MKTTINIFVLLNLMSAIHLNGQQLTKVNDVTYGGVSNDFSVFSFRDTSGNFYTFGTIGASSPPEAISTQFGGTDYSVVKYDKNGNKLWDMAYGGTSNEQLYKVIPNSDGFTLIGISYSDASGNKSDAIPCNNPFNSSLAIANRVTWIVHIDFNGQILSQHQLCLSVNFPGYATGVVFVDSITDFKRLTTGQYILCGNFIGYGGYNANYYGAGYGAYYVTNVAGYIRLDSMFNELNSVCYASTVNYPGGSNVMYMYYSSSTAGQVVELTDGNLICSWTYRGNFSESQCGNYSATNFSYVNTNVYSSTDVMLGNQTYGSTAGSAWAKQLIYSNPYIYLVCEHIPLPGSSPDYESTCAPGGFYQRTAPARTVAAARDCWIVQLSMANVPINDFAYGAGASLHVNDIILDDNNNFMLGTSVNSGIAFDKSGQGYGGVDYWLLRINQSTMKVIQDFTVGGSNDDNLGKISTYNDIVFLTGASYSGQSGMKTTNNESGTTSTCDQWTVLMCQVPSPPVVVGVSATGIVPACSNENNIYKILNPIAGYTYTWYNQNGTVIGVGPTEAISTTSSSLTSTTSSSSGSSNSSINTITYSVTSNNGYCSSSAYTFSVYPIPIPNQPTITTPSVICYDSVLNVYSSLSTNPSLSGANYLTRWYEADSTTMIHTGDTLKMLNLLRPLTVLSTAIDSFCNSNFLNGYAMCASPLLATSVKINQPGAPIISGDSLICKHASSLSYQVLNDSGGTVLWYTNKSKLLYTGPDYVLNSLQQNDTIAVKIISKYGCPSLPKKWIIRINGDTLNFTANPTALNPGTATQFVNTSKGGVSYYWAFGDNSYATEKSPWHYYNQAGVYTVMLAMLDSAGCQDTLIKSAYIKVNEFSGIEQIFNNGAFKVYPNPFSNQIIVSINDTTSTPQQVFTLRVFNLLGQCVIEKSTVSGNLIDTSYLPNGPYFIELNSNGQTYRMTVLKSD